MHLIEKKLEELGISLPEPAAAVANYVPFQRVGEIVYVSGQLPFGPDGLMFPGMVPSTISIEEARQAARQCGVQLLAQAKAACEGDWERLVRCVKIGGFVQAEASFTQHPQIINGVSDLMVEVLGDAGRHARFAVGASSLPLGACVEIEAIFHILPA
ncbi:MAG TPA: hypothetical protein DCE42_09295 [Myxococcales bacterium]|nr:hypothetical protein [Deltaproteobacteria bacterium]HAA54940.1 hypothetical protein [Myxococcales bacterium]|tara:strand:+ start:1594 stop:2064 length:471 start_codon:yes stop_codon:yes gene_type:complete